jgi:hypothetical protein
MYRLYSIAKLLSTSPPPGVWLTFYKKSCSNTCSPSPVVVTVGEQIWATFLRGGGGETEGASLVSYTQQERYLTGESGLPSYFCYYYYFLNFQKF